MLTHLFQALIAHLGSLDIPVWLADCVPQGTPLPYITAEIKAPLNTGAGSLTLTCFPCADAAHADRLAQADALLALLPVRGLWLAIEEGAVILLPEGPAVCVQDAGLQGLRMAWTLHFFPTQ